MTYKRHETAKGSSQARRQPGSAKADLLYVSPDAFKPLDELAIREIVEWLPHLFGEAEVRKLKRANPKLAPKQVLKY